MSEPLPGKVIAAETLASTHPTRASRRAQARVGPMPMLPHLQELEAWRALAALAVMLTHAGFLSGATGRGTLPGFLARMDIGVAVFFVLSGFLLYRPYALATARDEPQPSTRRFVTRRVARIVPAWLAVLAGTLLLVPQSRSAPTTVWLVNLVQLQALRLEWDLPGLAQLWSLSTEVAFYAFLPLLALLVRRLVTARSPMTHLLSVVALIPLAWVFRILVNADVLPNGYAWVRTMPAMIDWFALGMILAVIMTYRDRWHRVVQVLTHSANALLVLGAACFWVLTTSIAGPYDLRPPTPWQASMKHLGYGIVAATLIYPSALGARGILTDLLRSRVLAYLGKISYAFFLWHLPVMFWVRATLGYELFAYGFWVTILATTVVTTVLSALSWHLLERPLLERVRRRT